MSHNEQQQNEHRWNEAIAKYDNRYGSHFDWTEQMKVDWIRIIESEENMKIMAKKIEELEEEEDRIRIIESEENMKIIAKMKVMAKKIEVENFLSVFGKNCICGNNLNKRWVGDGSDVVCDDCQLGGKNDTWIRSCYNCGEEDPKGKESIWKWIGDDPDDCSFICQNCNKEEEDREKHIYG